MSEYRVGQRVRIEWPNGSAVEGVLSMERVPDSLSIVVPRAGGERTLWQPDYAGDDRTVTILSEPRPDEPQGLGAVVEASCVHEAKGLRRLWLRMEEGFWVSAGWSGTPTYGEASDEWPDLIDPVVLSEGWTADE